MVIGVVKEFFEVVTEYSPKNFHELRYYLFYPLSNLSKDLEEFFDGWKNRIPQKSFSLIVVTNYGLKWDYDIMGVIEKYKNLSVVKKFQSIIYGEGM